MSLRPKRVYIALEGGAAKGFAHVGALHAIDEARQSNIVKVEGVAGTSAGALAGALYAAGYSAAQMFDRRKGGGDLLTSLSNVLAGRRGFSHIRFADATSLFGRNGWRQIGATLRLTSWMAGWKLWVSLFFFSLIVFSLVVGGVLGILDYLRGGPVLKQLTQKSWISVFVIFSSCLFWLFLRKIHFYRRISKAVRFPTGKLSEELFDILMLPTLLIGLPFLVMPFLPGNWSDSLRIWLSWGSYLIFSAAVVYCYISLARLLKGMARLGAFGVTMSAAALPLLTYSWVSEWPPIVAQIAGLAVVIAIGGTAIISLRLLGGLANVDDVRSIVSAALKLKVYADWQPGKALSNEQLDAALEKPEIVFRDFAARSSSEGHSRPTLKIVGTNIAHERLELFSPETTPDVAVADAVASSICLPVIFRAYRIKPVGQFSGGTFFDGGLVSNLPAWPFDEERALDQDALTIAFEIAEPPHSPNEDLYYKWPVPAARTAIFGANDLNKRAAGRLHVVSLPARIDLMGFDARREEVGKVVDAAYAVASRSIGFHAIRREEILQQACDAIHSLASLYLQPLLVDGHMLRVAIARRDGGFRRAFRIAHATNYDLSGGADEGMLLGADTTFVSEYLASESSVMLYDQSSRSFLDRAFAAKGFTSHLPTPSPENRLRKRAAWPARRWAFCTGYTRAGLATEFGGECDLPKYLLIVDGDHHVACDVTAGEIGAVLDLLGEKVLAQSLQELSLAIDNDMLLESAS